MNKYGETQLSQFQIALTRFFLFFSLFFDTDRFISNREFREILKIRMIYQYNIIISLGYALFVILSFLVREFFLFFSPPPPLSLVSIYFSISTSHFFFLVINNDNDVFYLLTMRSVHSTIILK